MANRTTTRTKNKTRRDRQTRDGHRLRLNVVNGVARARHRSYRGPVVTATVVERSAVDGRVGGNELWGGRSPELVSTTRLHYL